MTIENDNMELVFFLSNEQKKKQIEITWYSRIGGESIVDKILESKTELTCV